MIKDSYGFELAKQFKETGLDFNTLPLVEEPFSVFIRSKTTEGEDMFTPRQICFYDTEVLNEVGRFFQEHGVYTKADRVYNKYEYRKFWSRETNRRKHGLTVPCELFKDSDGTWKRRNVFITGEHYGYLNYAVIKRISEEDLENERDDSLELIKQKQDKDKKALKKDIDFTDFWDGDFYYFSALDLARIEGKHLVIGKARRKGYSYKNGWVCANRADLFPNTITGMAAYDSSSIFPEGTFKMTNDYLQFIYDNTIWRKRRLRSSEDYLKFGYRLSTSADVERGYKSSIICKSFGPAQPGALRGKDADFIIVEEAGKARNLDDFLSSTLPTLGAGKYITGTMVVFGTGGGEENYWEQFESLFYDPDINDFLVFENLFDKDAEGEGCGFFVPDWANKEGFYDSHGNSDTVGAVEYELAYRAKLKKKGLVKKLRDRGMEYCFSPAEAFSRGSDNIFPTELIEEQIAKVRKDPLLKNLGRAGKIVLEDGFYKFKDVRFMDAEEAFKLNPVITDLKLRPGRNNKGCYVEFHPPFKQDGKIPDNLYRIWHDPFGVDKEEAKQTAKHSFGCFYVYERVNNITPSKGGRLMGVFIGRPETTDEVNELMYKAGKRFNAKIQFEKNVGTTYNWFRQAEELEMLVPEPRSIFDSEDEALSKKVKYGIHINEERKRNGALYLKDFLLQKVDKDINGNWRLRLHYIYDVPFLRELLKWNTKGNFDRVSTVIVGMYDIKEQFFVEIEPARPAVNIDSIFEREWN